MTPVLSGKLRSGNNAPAVSIHGLDPLTLLPGRSSRATPPADGQGTFNLTELLSRRHAVLVPADFAAGRQLRVGDTLLLSQAVEPLPLQVVAIADDRLPTRSRCWSTLAPPSNCLACPANSVRLIWPGQKTQRYCGAIEQVLPSGLLLVPVDELVAGQGRTD